MCPFLYGYISYTVPVVEWPFSWSSISLSSNFVRSGPQKLVNNILEGLNGLENVVFNDEIYDNNYFVTYQKKDSDNLINILNKAKKVVVGPLYNIESYLELASLSNNYVLLY